MDRWKRSYPQYFQSSSPNLPSYIAVWWACLLEVKGLLWLVRLQSSGLTVNSDVLCMYDPWNEAKYLQFSPDTHLSNQSRSSSRLVVLLCSAMWHTYSHTMSIPHKWVYLKCLNNVMWFEASHTFCIMLDLYISFSYCYCPSSWAAKSLRVFCTFDILLNYYLKDFLLMIYIITFTDICFSYWFVHDGPLSNVLNSKVRQICLQEKNVNLHSSAGSPAD